MNEQAGGWIEILSNNDADALWAKLFKLVSRHSSIRTLLNSRKVAGDRLEDMFIDITQDLFLKLYRKNRWNHYLETNYLDSSIEHELYHIEIPNLVSLILRERHPEAYRMSRRISDLIQTSPLFRRFGRGTANQSGRPERTGKLILRVYGLHEWPDDKAIKPPQNLYALIEDVNFRKRDRRRAGRGSTSHIIISNNDLTDLLIETFTAIDSPADIRIVRSLVLSKLPIEDSRFVSLDAGLVHDGTAAPEPFKVDFADDRPTPEQIFLDNESIQQVETIADDLLQQLREMVRNKPNRYRRLAKIAWHCYFDPSSPSQTSVARMIGISNSLVTHYRKLFDAVIRDVPLDAGQYIPFLHAFGKKLEESISETGGGRQTLKGRRTDSLEKPTYERYPVALAATANRF